VLIRRQKSSIYNVMLIIAVAALAIGCLMMVLELAQYGFQFKPPANLRSAAIAVPFELQV